MKSFVFPYYVSFGKDASADGEIEFSLSDKNAARLIRSAKYGGRWRLNEDDEITDIYDRVYQAVYQMEKEGYVDNTSRLPFATSQLSAEELDDEIDDYLDNLTIGINYPEELQFLDCTTRKRRIKKQSFESITIDCADVWRVFYSGFNTDKIIYTDDGKKLLYVPRKYTGIFSLPSHVEVIDSRAFKDCKMISGIDLGDKIQEIPSRAFELCKSLESITIPPSVKHIADFAFTGCVNLHEIILPDGLLTIENTAFNWCHSLHTLRLPASVQSINTWITGYNNGLGSIYFEGMNTEIEDGRNGEFPYATMYVKPGSRAEKFAVDHKIRHFIIE